MTQYFSDIRDFLHDRFGSPFWLSTLASWLIINWEITVTAIFENENMGTEYLHLYFSTHNQIIYTGMPLLIGLLYAVLSGVIRELIEGSAKVLRSKISSWFYPESVTLQANIPRKSPSALTGAINCRKIGCECLKRAA